MKITIQTPDAGVPKGLTSLVTRDIDKLEKFFPSISSAQVYFRETGDFTKLCEIRLVIPGNDLFTSKQAETFEIAMRDAIDALKHQIDRLRTNLERQRSTPL